MKKITLIAVLSFLLIGNAFTSNPVTLTSFYSAFDYLNEVQTVLDRGMIDGRMISYLLDETTPIDEKAGIMNALVEKNTTQTNALTIKQLLARKYGENWQSMDLSKLSGSELFCLGYLSILDEEGNPENGLPILKMATEKNPNSSTINLIYSLALAQEFLNQNKDCEAWKACNIVKTNTSLNGDFDQGAANQVFEVMETYNNGCE